MIELNLSFVLKLLYIHILHGALYILSSQVFEKDKTENSCTELEISGGRWRAALEGSGEESVCGEGQQSEAMVRWINFRACL